MRHYKARQRGDGSWDYTTTWGKWVMPVGYCVGWLDPDPALRLTDQVERLEEHRDRFHTDGHATAEEARECYRQYLLDQQLRFFDDPGETSTLHQCRAPGCEEYTAGSGFIGGSRSWSLCEDHRTREVVDGLLVVGESWES